MPQNKQNTPGSQDHREPAFLILGKLRRAHGVQGEIPLEVYTELLELLAPNSVVYVGENHQPITIEKRRWKKPLLLLKFKGINDRETASGLTNELLYVHPSQLPSLPDGEFYYHEMLGLSVYDEEDTYLGILTEILGTGANDVFLILSDSGEEILIPDIEEMVISIDLDQGRMVVAKMDWYGEGA